MPVHGLSEQSTQDKHEELLSKLLCVLAADDVVGFCQYVVMTYSAVVVSAQEDLMDDFHWCELPKAIVTCWTLLLEYHNSDVQAALTPFDELEVLFIAECCSEIIKTVERGNMAEDTTNELRKKVRASRLTMNALTIMWPNGFGEVTTTRSSIIRIRRVWLFSLTGSQVRPKAEFTLSGSGHKDIFSEIKSNLMPLRPFRLPHLRNWNIIDADHAKLLSRYCKTMSQ